MKAVITILIIAGVVFGIYKGWEYWDSMKESGAKGSKSPAEQVTSEQLGGLPRELEASYQQVQKGGPKALKVWLDKVKASGMVKDPRLGAIELDYVLLITKDDPLEAKRIFQKVKERTPADSPLAPRIKALEKTYQ